MGGPRPCSPRRLQPLSRMYGDAWRSARSLVPEDAQVSSFTGAIACELLPACAHCTMTAALSSSTVLNSPDSTVAQ